MNGRERYFNTTHFQGKFAQWSHGPVVRNRTFFAGGSWGAGSNPGVSTSSFFSFITFLPFGFLLFILTADPVIFARFLRKRISSKRYTNIIAIDFLSQYQSPNHGL